MRPLVLILALLVPGLARAQQPLAPAVEQADDEEPPPLQGPPPTLPPPAAAAPVATTPIAQSAHTTLLLPPPPGWSYRVSELPPTRERRWGMFTAGLVTLTVAYTATLQAGVPTGEWFLDVPFIGPLMETARLTSSSSGSSGDAAVIGWLDFLLVADAAAQIGGLALAIAGPRMTREKRGAQRIELVPCGAGAAIRGSF